MANFWRTLGVSLWPGEWEDQRSMCATKLLAALLAAAPWFIATNATAAEHLAPCTHLGDEYYGLVEARIPADENRIFHMLDRLQD